MGEAVRAVIQNYHPLVLLLEEEAAEPESNPVSIGLLTQLTNYRMVALLHFIGDVPTTRHSEQDIPTAQHILPQHQAPGNSKTFYLNNNENYFWAGFF